MKHLPVSEHVSKGQIRVYGGKMVAPFELQPDDVNALTCIHATSMLNRYTGHTIRPYSVLEHSLILTKAVPERLKQAAFIHDWSEAYFNDIASPVKHRFTMYKEYEREAQKAIFDHMSVDFDLMEELDEYDKRICSDEMRVLMDPPYYHVLKPLGVHIPTDTALNWRNMRGLARIVLTELFPQYTEENYIW